MNLCDKTNLKKLLAFILVGLIITLYPLSIFANSVDYYRTYDVASVEIVSFEEQYRRLKELSELSSNHNLFTTQTDGHEIIKIPPIIFTSPIDEDGRIINNGIFFIGIYYNTDHLQYGDIDAIQEIIDRGVSSDIINFVLDFTAIPYSNALFYYSMYMLTPGLPLDFIFTEPGPVWGEDRSHLNYPYTNISTDNFLPESAVTLRMGHMISTAGGKFTVGHPTNATGPVFMTSVHQNYRDLSANQKIVNFNNNRVGTITNSIFSIHQDVTFVTLSGSNTISRAMPPPFNWVGGFNITNFRGIARVSDPVASVRGMSGVQFSEILSVNATTGGGRTNKILVYPDRNSTAGDSGAALLHRTQSSVLGTRAGITTIIHPTTFRIVVAGFYTNVHRY